MQYLKSCIEQGSDCFGFSFKECRLDFKKRGAHTHQFIISDTGCGIAEEQRENIFKPFTEVKDLTQGDGLGLPICALIAAKMDGSLTLDSSYAKGTRFVLELHA